MIVLWVANCFHIKIGCLAPHWIQRAQSTMREEWTQHRNICLKKKKELSGLNFLREIKETSKKCKSETLNPMSTQGSLYHFTSNHANGLKWWFCSVPWESLKSRDPLGQGIQEVKTLFKTTLNVIACSIMFWVHTGVLQKQDMWYKNSTDEWN